MRRGKLSSDFYTKTRKENGVVQVCVHTLPELYKYQPVNECSLSNFEHDEIWGTAPIAFNDPYDCAVCYSQSKLDEAIRNCLSPERERAYKALFCMTRKDELVKNLARSLVLQDLLKKQYVVSCFSVNNDSEIMWAHYADAAKGFCLAYEGKSLLEVARESFQSMIDKVDALYPYKIILPQVDDADSIMPVIYDDRKTNITDQIIKVLPYELRLIDAQLGVCPPDEMMDLYAPDNLQELINLSIENRHVYQNMLCRKNKCWQYEQEWRIIAHNINIYTGNPNDNHMRIGNAPAKAVYIGERMPDYARRVVIDIARNKNIPVYEMRSVMRAHDFRLKAIEISV